MIQPTINSINNAEAGTNQLWIEIPSIHQVPLEQLLDNNPVPTFVINADHVITHWNRACEEIIGVPAFKMVGTNNQWQAFYNYPRPVMADIMVNSDHEALVSQFYQGKYRRSKTIPGAFEAEDYFPKFPGGGRWLFFPAAPLHDNNGNIVGAIETLQDITDRKIAEQHLETLKNELELRVAERTRDLASTNLILRETVTRLEETQAELLISQQAAESSNKAKSQFLAAMSHEIRTPLNAVIGMGALLEDTELNSTQAEFVETIKSSGESLLVLINDILDYSKIEAGRLDLESHPFDLHECIESALDQLSLKATQKGVELIHNINPSLPHAAIGDSTRIKQILGNLLSNAVKFTENGHVVLTVEVVDGQPGKSLEAPAPVTLKITVEDTGIGIPSDKLNRLFKLFSQVDASTTRKYGGTGLGLAISERLAQLMDGHIWVESTGVTGQGSRFFCELKLDAAHEAVSQWEIDNRKILVGKKVLVVDDNAINLKIAERVAECFGMVPILLTDPIKAVIAIKEGLQFDIALLDLQMPGMDGVALAKNIHQISVSSPPLVLLSSLGCPLDLDDKAQFFGTLSKPYRFTALFDIIVRALNSHPSASIPNPTSNEILTESLVTLTPKILLVEDNPINQKVATYMLNKMNYQADIANNGKEAIEAIHHGGYDLVLMDLQMPIMGGVEATISIRNDQEIHDQPYIIALTANVMESDRQRCQEAGMDDFLAKPLRPSELAAAITHGFISRRGANCASFST